MAFDPHSFATQLLGDNASQEGDTNEPQGDTEPSTTEPQPEPDVPATGETGDTGETGQQSEPGDDSGSRARPEASDGDKPDGEPQQTVPLPVVVQQRQEIAQLKQALQQMYGQLQTIQQQKSAESPAEQPPPDETFKPSVRYEDDPTQFLFEQNHWLQRQLGNVAQHLYGLYQSDAEKQRQQQEFSKRQNEENQFKSYVQSLEHSYRSQNPKYDDAVNFLREKRKMELEGQIKAAGRDPADPNVQRELRRHIVGEFTGFARSVIQAGQNPAEALFNYASSLGFAPGQGTAQQATKQQTIAPNSEYERARRGQEAAFSASTMPGNTPSQANTEGAAEPPASFGSLAEALKKDLYRGR